MENTNASRAIGGYKLWFSEALEVSGASGCWPIKVVQYMIMWVSWDDYVMCLKTAFNILLGRREVF